ncbi:MAG: hypothetical protein IBX71_04175, partial [Candidatus Desulforudis sp.]|nr:hypothetical protein [Desulforudis sp.]
MITIGFSPHRVEVLESMAREMEGHDLIILEEPPSEMLGEMLAGRMGVEEYVEELVPAFPLFTTNVCGLLRRLYGAGKRIEQVEPYLATLERIYGLLDDEGVPAETVCRLPEVSEVYSAESRATGALMNFYRKMGGGDFRAAVTACREFAHADAARLRLRARLRTEAISAGVRAGEYGGKIYVEAGYIHLALFVFLRRSLAEAVLNVRVRPRYLL